MAETPPPPNSPAANSLGCKCPVGPPNMDGSGTVIDGVREWKIHPDCPLHGKPEAWFTRAESGR